MKTSTYQVESKEAALMVAQELIKRSAWFAVEPRPFDWYSFSIKPGEGHEIVFNFPISFDLFKGGKLISRHSVRNNDEMVKVVSDANLAYDGITVENMQGVCRLHEYQNADYRSIYTSRIILPRIGECWIVLILEPTNEAIDASRPEDETFAGLYLVSPKLAGPEIIKECLQATTGFVYPYSPEKAAVALAEFGKRITMKEETGADGELLLNAMRGIVNEIDPALLANSGIDKLYESK